jgi:hypothetical protein
MRGLVVKVWGGRDESWSWGDVKEEETGRRSVGVCRCERDTCLGGIISAIITRDPEHIGPPPIQTLASIDIEIAARPLSPPSAPPPHPIGYLY